MVSINSGLVCMQLTIVARFLYAFHFSVLTFSKLYHFVCMMKFIFSTAREERYGWDAGTGVYLYCVVILL
jgi:hypothetical protein